MSAQLQELPPTLAAYPPGIHADIPENIYHAREPGVINKGALDQIARTPAHYRAWLDGGETKETPALLFGRALHALVLEPALFARQWAEQPNFGDLRTKAAKEARDAWLTENPGKALIGGDDWQRLHAMRDAVMSHPIASALFSSGVAEATAIWEESGLLCKARMDYWRPDIAVIGDLKSTEDASPGAFARSVTNFRYHVQQAHYSEGVMAAGFSEPTFVFVAVEKSPPYAVSVYQLDGDAIERGHELRRRDIGRLLECIDTDTWPAYPSVVNTLSLPAWALRD